MQDNRSSRCDTQRESSPSTASENTTVERAALALVLSRHPERLTSSELAREFGRPAADRDLERAVQSLVDAGLLHRHGDFLLPSRSALRFDRLMDL